MLATGEASPSYSLGVGMRQPLWLGGETFLNIASFHLKVEMRRKIVLDTGLKAENIVAKTS